MDSIALAVEMYAENHAAGLAQFAQAIIAGDDAAIQLALTMLKAHMKVDGERYSVAVVDRMQSLLVRFEERLIDTQDMVKALAGGQAELMVLLRSVAAGRQLDQALTEAAA